MDSYDLKWKKSAFKELKKINKLIIPKIISAAQNLTSDPHPANSKKLFAAEHTYRIRVGNYRIIYSIKESELVIEIVKVGHRKDIYKH